jgi:hypothetical protein
MFPSAMVQSEIRLHPPWQEAICHGLQVLEARDRLWRWSNARSGAVSHRSKSIMSNQTDASLKDQDQSRCRKDASCYGSRRFACLAMGLCPWISCTSVYQAVTIVCPNDVGGTLRDVS